MSIKAQVTQTRKWASLVHTLVCRDSTQVKEQPKHQDLYVENGYFLKYQKIRRRKKKKINLALLQVCVSFDFCEVSRPIYSLLCPLYKRNDTYRTHSRRFSCSFVFLALKIQTFFTKQAWVTVKYVRLFVSLGYLWAKGHSYRNQKSMPKHLQFTSTSEVPLWISRPSHFLEYVKVFKSLKISE